MSSQQAQRGSILVYILIAVILFGALSYAVTGMMRGAGDSIREEKSGVHISEILTYARSVRETIRILRISNNCEDVQISFERSPFDGSDPQYVNTNSPSDFSCHVFHPSGGGLGYQPVDEIWLDRSKTAESYYGEYLFSGEHGIPNIGTSGSASDPTMKEILLIIPWVDRSVCRKINEQLGHIAKGQPIPQESGSISLTPFIGTFGTWALVSENSSIEGKPAGCFAGSTGVWSGSYYFYHLLMAR
ncbi:MAG: hypothetical protein ACRBDL_06435 [Alphaproteobacteria bacterium]